MNVRMELQFSDNDNFTQYMWRMYVIEHLYSFSVATSFQSHFKYIVVFLFSLS